MNLDLMSAEASLLETAAAIASLDREALQDLARLVSNLQATEGTLWTMGNGGSASTSAHLACDVGKGIGASHTLPIRAISLNEQLVTQSAWANDYGFEFALRNQLEQLARAEDAVLCISGSGNSPNIVHAAAWAKSRGLPVAVLVGREGGKVCEYADLALRVDSVDMQVLENVHLVVVHWLFKALAVKEAGGTGGQEAPLDLRQLAASATEH